MDNNQYEQWVHQSAFIFRGTIIKVNPSLESREQNSPTYIAEVNSIIFSKPIYSGFLNQHLTLEFPGPAAIKEQASGVFFVNGKTFGNALLATVVGYESDSNNMDDTTRVIQQLTIKMNDDKLKERVDLAYLIVQGKISQVKRTIGTTSSISEHNPDWHEATLEIKTLVKGSYALKTVTVTFASSRDVRWYNSPKFVLNQESIVLLHRKSDLLSKVNALSAKIVEAIPDGDVLTALHPLDVLSVDQLPRVQNLMK